ncbi:hypothetical protein F0562_003704 [Nyssa sinensis]|uniref:Uncharacterized protein n=1 Tax=Nyssa sinensis TaxID=561372 RepID=A0A5J5C0K5_9ASTE|nr:hypothetical protein F0562_003704 [Nyssa sinensis]
MDFIALQVLPDFSPPSSSQSPSPSVPVNPNPTLPSSIISPSQPPSIQSKTENDIFHRHHLDPHHQIMDHHNESQPSMLDHHHHQEPFSPPPISEIVLFQDDDEDSRFGCDALTNYEDF